MTKSAAEVEMEVEASRGRLDRTVEALKEKMTPSQLFDEASHAMGGAGQQLLSKFLDQAKENPIPLAVVGIGLAWLMTSSGKGSKASGSSYGAASQPSHNALGEKIQQLGDKATDLIGAAKDKIGQGASSAGDALGGAARQVNVLAGAGKEKAADYGQQAMDGLSSLMDREPLVFAAVGIAVGAALGAALPSTDAENQTVGPLRDRLLEKGKTLAHDGVEHASEAVMSTVSAVKGELQKPAEDGKGITDKLGAAATAGAQAVKEQLGGGS